MRVVLCGASLVMMWLSTKPICSRCLMDLGGWVGVCVFVTVIIDRWEPSQAFMYNLVLVLGGDQWVLVMVM